MSNENKNAKINKIKEYANIPASGIFLAYTIIQTILFCVWYAKEAALIVRTAGVMPLVKESVIIFCIPLIEYLSKSYLIFCLDSKSLALL